MNREYTMLTTAQECWGRDDKYCGEQIGKDMEHRLKVYTSSVDSQSYPWVSQQGSELMETLLEKVSQESFYKMN